jgi:hypothetical protein
MCLGAWTQANLITKKDMVDIICRGKKNEELML